MAEPTLERGSEGQDVRDLQEALIELGFKPGEVDGDFGVYTESAVQAFQTWAQVTVDGIVGEQTWEKLDDADKSDPTLQEGSEGVAVRGLQRRLIALGFGPDEIDGRFGPQTAAAVRAFQKQIRARGRRHRRRSDVGAAARAGAIGLKLRAGGAAGGYASEHMGRESASYALALPHGAEAVLRSFDAAAMTPRRRRRARRLLPARPVSLLDRPAPAPAGAAAPGDPDRAHERHLVAARPA